MGVIKRMTLSDKTVFFNAKTPIIFTTHAYYSVYSELLFYKSGAGHQDLVYFPQCNSREHFILTLSKCVILRTLR